jgi:NAD(P)-dependent dehydrogenase (short-subunit alcohol dehydrogenase family)
MKENYFDVSGRVVIVTGGLGQLGRTYSLALLDQGAKVAVLDNMIDEGRVQSGFGGRATDNNVMFLEADVTDRASLEAALGQVVERWGAPFGLVNNAAIDSPPNAPAEENGPFETYPESSFDRVMEVNVKGVFLCCQVFGAAMAETRRGSIVNIASTYGLVSPDQSIYDYRRQGGDSFYKPVAYSVSKSSLLNLTRYLATYWAEKNVRVNTLTLAGVFNNQDEQFLENYTKRVPLGRMAREDEYRGAVIFLMSDASSYMTGSNMVIDGGWTAW